MLKNFKKVVYIKPSAYGTGSIPIGAEGNVLLFIENSITIKLLIDFLQYGKAIVPLSSIKIIEE